MSGTFTTQTAVNPFGAYLLLSEQIKRVPVEFINSNNVYYDPYSITLTVYKPDFTQYLQETYSITSPNVKRDALGKYYIDFATTGLDTGDYQFIWTWRDASTGEFYYGTQYVFVVPVQVNAVFPYLRSQIDKAQKDLNTEYGYNDGQMWIYMKGGLQEINRMPPNTSFTFVDYPWTLHQQLLVDTATFVALQAQGLCAIDSDANYSLQGNSFVVDHWSKISSYLSMLQGRLNIHLKQFKLNYLTRISAVKVERGPGFRQVAMFNAAPSGVSFGNILGVR